MHIPQTAAVLVVILAILDIIVLVEHVVAQVINIGVVITILLLIQLFIIVQKEPEAEADHLGVRRVLQADIQLG